MPIVDSQTGLQGVVIGVGGSFLVVDVQESVRKSPRHIAVVDAVARQIGGGDLRLAWLVDVAEAGQLVAVGSDITNLKNRPSGKFLLKIQIKILHVRGAQVLIHTECIADGAGEAENR